MPLGMFHPGRQKAVQLNGAMTALEVDPLGQTYGDGWKDVKTYY